MEAHIQLAGINIDYIIESLDVKKSQNHRVTPFIGQDGSDISFVSSESRVLSFNSICKHDEMSGHGRDHRIQDYIWLAETYNKKAGALRSPSKSGINGNYLVTGFDYTENTRGDYEIKWELTQQTQFNVTQKTFKVWNKAQASKKKNKKTAKKNSGGSNLNSNTKYLLKNCGVMQRNDSKKGIKCVKCLQIFLQSQGYYKKYKLDGWYSKYTQAAVKSLQQKYKLKVTGKWDKETIKFFQKKFKYPVDLITASNKKLQWSYVSRKPLTFSRKQG